MPTSAADARQLEKRRRGAAGHQGGARLQILAYNLKRAMKILGTGPLIAPMKVHGG